jgi:hypothetical protein
VNRIIPIVTFFLLSLTPAFGQERLILEHRKKIDKIKYIDLDRTYYIQTRDTSYYSQIVGFTDTTLSIMGWVKTDKDTSYTYFPAKHKARDTSYTVVVPIYKIDTINILFTDVKALKKDWFKNKGWLRLPAYFIAGAVMAIVLLPVAAIDKGKEGVKNWAAFEGMLIGLSAPPLFVGTRKTKYDLTKKWALKVQK